MNILRQNNLISPIYSISNFLSEDEITKIFKLVKQKEFVSAKVGNAYLEEEEKNKTFLTDYKFINLKYKKYLKTIRETNLKWIFKDQYSNWLFDKIIKCINEVNAYNYNYILKFVEDFQFSEYTSKTKGFYGKHNDCGTVQDINNFVNIRKLSFSIQLSDPDEYEGGELRFYTKENTNYTIGEKNKGTIIFFPSNITHEVTPITKGNRYSLVSWVCGPNLF